jgi:hypothetical protein
MGQILWIVPPVDAFRSLAGGSTATLFCACAAAPRWCRVSLWQAQAAPVFVHTTMTLLSVVVVILIFCLVATLCRSLVQVRQPVG